MLGLPWEAARSPWPILAKCEFVPTKHMTKCGGSNSFRVRFQGQDPQVRQDKCLQIGVYLCAYFSRVPCIPALWGMGPAFL